MSKSSLYESNWINLVFENRNKEYGAFQLRQETTKTSLLALFISISLCALFIAVPKVLQSFHLTETPVIEEVIPMINLAITPVNLTNRIKEKKPDPKSITHEVKPQMVTEKVTIKTLAHPIIVQASQATADIPKNDVMIAIPIDPNARIGTSSTIYSGTSTPTGTNNAVGASAGIDHKNTIVTASNLDKLPAFPGGIDKFYNYVGRNFETPDINEQKMVRIMVYFVVEKDGSMTDIQVKNNPGYGLAKEAIRILKSLKTKWTPGQIDTKPVRTAYTLPISVQMN